MMTPAQLQQYEFKMAGRNAYKADDVDSFFAEVLISYEKIYRENSELIKRISLLADRLQKLKNDETDISQAVMSAQKAADMITKDAEAKAAQTKEEAENILAAAKGEAAIIKSDAEKQAIADSELLLSMARDKAEDIMKKAKEKAHGILIAANDSASNTVGAANRTITSESIHYDMLKKEVSEFRSSILAQYKAHIELISKLPELAIQEASKIEVATPPVADVSVENLESKLEEDVVGEPEDSIIEFSDADETPVIENVAENESELETTVECETEDDNLSDEIPTIETTTDLDLNEQSQDVDDDSAVQDIPVSKKFTINTDDLTFDGFDDDVSEDEIADDEAFENKFDSVEVEDSNIDVEPENVEEDSVVENDSSEAFDTIDENEDADGPDVILSFDSVPENNDNEESFELSLNDFSDSKPLKSEEIVRDEKQYEDIFSNSDTEQFDDVILTFDDVEDTTPTTFESDVQPDYNSASGVEESAQSKRDRYAKMFGDDYDDDDNDSISSFFGSIESITVDEPDNDITEKKRKTGFFRRKK